MSLNKAPNFTDDLAKKIETKADLIDDKEEITMTRLQEVAKNLKNDSETNKEKQEALQKAISTVADENGIDEARIWLWINNDETLNNAKNSLLTQPLKEPIDTNSDPETIRNLETILSSFNFLQEPDSNFDNDTSKAVMKLQKMLNKELGFNNGNKIDLPGITHLDENGIFDMQTLQNLKFLIDTDLSTNENQDISKINNAEIYKMNGDGFKYILRVPTDQQDNHTLYIVNSQNGAIKEYDNPSQEDFFKKQKNPPIILIKNGVSKLQGNNDKDTNSIRLAILKSKTQIDLPAKAVLDKNNDRQFKIDKTAYEIHPDGSILNRENHSILKAGENFDNPNNWKFFKEQLRTSGDAYLNEVLPKAGFPNGLPPFHELSDTSTPIKKSLKDIETPLDVNEELATQNLKNILEMPPEKRAQYINGLIGMMKEIPLKGIQTSTKENIKHVQKILVYLGVYNESYNNPKNAIDGIYGKLSKLAMKALQKMIAYTAKNLLNDPKLKEYNSGPLRAIEVGFNGMRHGPKHFYDGYFAQYTCLALIGYLDLQKPKVGQAEPSFPETKETVKIEKKTIPKLQVLNTYQGNMDRQNRQFFGENQLILERLAYQLSNGNAETFKIRFKRGDDPHIVISLGMKSNSFKPDQYIRLSPIPAKFFGDNFDRRELGDLVLKLLNNKANPKAKTLKEAPTGPNPSISTINRGELIPSIEGGKSKLYLFVPALGSYPQKVYQVKINNQINLQEISPLSEELRSCDPSKKAGNIIYGSFQPKNFTKIYNKTPEDKNYSGLFAQVQKLGKVFESKGETLNSISKNTDPIHYYQILDPALKSKVYKAKKERPAGAEYLIFEGEKAHYYRISNGEVQYYDDSNEAKNADWPTSKFFKDGLNSKSVQYFSLMDKMKKPKKPETSISTPTKTKEQFNRNILPKNALKSIPQEIRDIKLKPQQRKYLKNSNPEKLPSQINARHLNKIGLATRLHEECQKILKLKIANIYNFSKSPNLKRITEKLLERRDQDGKINIPNAIKHLIVASVIKDHEIFVSAMIKKNKNFINSLTKLELASINPGKIRKNENLKKAGEFMKKHKIKIFPEAFKILLPPEARVKGTGLERRAYEENNDPLRNLHDTSYGTPTGISAKVEGEKMILHINYKDKNDKQLKPKIFKIDLSLP
ncbi:hypothetical protein KJ632_01720 [Patescibacteria group bacterium]|nr:hypothetical protein [Patescibacteria group bacterium]